MFDVVTLSQRDERLFGHQLRCRYHHGYVRFQPGRETTYSSHVLEPSERLGDARAKGIVEVVRYLDKAFGPEALGEAWSDPHPRVTSVLEGWKVGRLAYEEMSPERRAEIDALREDLVSSFEALQPSERAGRSLSNGNDSIGTHFGDPSTPRWHGVYRRVCDPGCHHNLVGWLWAKGNDAVTVQFALSFGHQSAVGFITVSAYPSGQPASKMMCFGSNPSWWKVRDRAGGHLGWLWTSCSNAALVDYQGQVGADNVAVLDTMRVSTEALA